MPTSPPDTQLGESAAEQVAALMDQVRTKDALVLQLTERLEQAAEQLDRLHRSGADKRHAGGGGGSRELIEQTGALTTRVEEALEAWNQTGPQFDYIVQRLDEIAGAMQGGHVASGDSKGGSRSSAPSHTPSGSASAPTSPGGSFWDKMKSNMLDGSPAPVSTSASAAPATASSSETTTDDSKSSADDVVSRIFAPAPVVIDIDAASIEELREAVTTRDTYISALISELRTAETFPPLPDDLKDSGIAPQELLNSLIEMESCMKTKMMRESLDLSLERARIARERSKLDQVKSHLESQIKRLSAGVADEATEQSPDDPATGKLSWLKRLKGGNKS